MFAFATDLERLRRESGRASLSWGRLAVVAMLDIQALYFSLVAFGNIPNFSANYAFVKGVMSMDTTFHDKDLMWRAITSVALYHVAYVGIIAWESATAVVCWVATVLGTRSLRASTSFARALKVSVLGLLMSTLLWAGPLQQESKALTRVRSQIRVPAISSSRVGNRMPVQWL
jgi:predicted small integral membrane protein